MSLSISVGPRGDMMHVAGITHNVHRAAREAGAHFLWSMKGERAGDFVVALQTALAALEFDPARFRAYDDPNGWGTYDGLVRFVRTCLEVFQAHPDEQVWSSA